jgi:hypothetical protein
MPQKQLVKTRPGPESGEFLVHLPPGWELRLRRVLKEVMADALPDVHEAGLSEAERERREQLRRRFMRDAICRYLSDLVTADIVGKEVALATRTRFGTRKGSLREHVQAILRGAAGS